MGTGVAVGANRAEDAVECALNSPLLNNNDIRGARNVLLNITSGDIEVTMAEVGLITDIVQNKAGFDADLIWGNGKDETLGKSLSVTIIATGFSTGSIPELNKEPRVVQEKNQSYEFEVVKNVVTPPAKPVKKEIITANQKYIEFDIKEEKRQEEKDFENLYPGTIKERHGFNKKPAEIDYAALSEEDVDNMENIPAYERRKIRMNDPKYKLKKSNFSISSDNKISDKNTYLHTWVD
jgi:cell division protein FtsZ